MVLEEELRPAQECDAVSDQISLVALERVTQNHRVNQPRPQGL